MLGAFSRATATTWYARGGRAGVAGAAGAARPAHSAPRRCVPYRPAAATAASWRPSARAPQRPGSKEPTLRASSCRRYLWPDTVRRAAVRILTVARCTRRRACLHASSGSWRIPTCLSCCRARWAPGRSCALRGTTRPFGRSSRPTRHRASSPFGVRAPFVVPPAPAAPLPPRALTPRCCADPWAALIATVEASLALDAAQQARIEYIDTAADLERLLADPAIRP